VASYSVNFEEVISKDVARCFGCTGQSAVPPPRIATRNAHMGSSIATRPLGAREPNGARFAPVGATPATRSGNGRVTWVVTRVPHRTITDLAAVFSAPQRWPHRSVHRPRGQQSPPVGRTSRPRPPCDFGAKQRCSTWFRLPARATSNRSVDNSGVTGAVTTSPPNPSPTLATARHRAAAIPVPVHERAGSARTHKDTLASSLGRHRTFAAGQRSALCARYAREIDGNGGRNARERARTHGLRCVRMVPRGLFDTSAGNLRAARPNPVIGRTLFACPPKLLTRFHSG
jgi:hypothetical protein